MVKISAPEPQDFNPYANLSIPELHAIANQYDPTTDDFGRMVHMIRHLSESNATVTYPAPRSDAANNDDSILFQGQIGDGTAVEMSKVVEMEEGQREMLTDEEIEFIRNEPPYFQDDQPFLGDEPLSYEGDEGEYEEEEGEEMSLEEMLADYEDIRDEIEKRIRALREVIGLRGEVEELNRY